MPLRLWPRQFLPPETEEAGRVLELGVKLPKCSVGSHKCPLTSLPPMVTWRTIGKFLAWQKIGKWAAWEKEADLKAEGFPGKESGADGIDKKRMPGAGAQRGWGVEKAPLTALASGLAEPVSSSSSGTKKPHSPGGAPLCLPPTRRGIREEPSQDTVGPLTCMGKEGEQSRETGSSLQQQQGRGGVVGSGPGEAAARVHTTQQKRVELQVLGAF